MQIDELLVALQLTEKSDAMRGSLAVAIELLSSAGEVIGRLRDFAGDGWLCATDDVQIRRFTPTSPLPTLSESAWPISAEAVKGETSLHFSRSGDGWQLATITRQPAVRDDELLLTQKLHARDCKSDLCYEVAWRTTDVAGLNELRPCAYRFTGEMSHDHA